LTRFLKATFQILRNGFILVLYFLKSIRGKLISIFILIKMIPVIALALLAGYAGVQLSEEVSDRSVAMADYMLESIQEVGDSVIEDSTIALDDKSRESIERLTTDTARAIANFLYQRDQDILLASKITLSEESFRTFIKNRTRPVYKHEDWQLTENKSHWQPVIKKLNADTAN